MKRSVRESKDTDNHTDPDLPPQTRQPHSLFFGCLAPDHGINVRPRILPQQRANRIIGRGGPSCIEPVVEGGPVEKRSAPDYRDSELYWSHTLGPTVNVLSTDVHNSQLPGGRMSSGWGFGGGIQAKNRSSGRSLSRPSWQFVVFNHVLIVVIGGEARAPPTMSRVLDRWLFMGFPHVMSTST